MGGLWGKKNSLNYTSVTPVRAQSSHDAPWLHIYTSQGTVPKYLI